MQTIITRYHAPTTKRGARYSATATAGQRITIKEQPDWTSGDMGHIEAVRALRKTIGNRWPHVPMVGGGLNERGDLVWVFDNERCPRVPADRAEPQKSQKVDALAARIVKRLIEDATDRRGWRQEWDMFDKDVQGEIKRTWRRVVQKELSAEDKRKSPK